MYYDLLPKIKNAGMARKKTFLTSYSSMDIAVGNILVKAEYLHSVEEKTIGKKKYIEVQLAYQEGKSVLNDFRLLSKPSRHLYSGYREMRAIKQGYGLAVISTSQGVMSGAQAKKEKVGGERLFEVW